MPPDFEAIANAVKQVESSGGTNVGPRYEPGFQRRYLQGKPQWEALAKRYGWKAVSSSYGPWQIMYPVAVELGFTGSPQQLADPTVNRQYFDKKFQRDYQATGGNLQKSLLRYNGGSDPTYPQRVLQFLTPSSRSTPIHPGGRMPTLDEMKLEGPELHEKILRELYRVDKNMQAMGPMTPQELRESYEKVKSGVVQVVSQMKSQRRSPGGTPPPGAPPGLPPPDQSRVQGDQVPPPPMTFGDTSDAMFRSTVPMANALWGPMLPGQRDREGAAAIHPLMDDQALLAQRRRARIAGPF